MKYKLIKTTDYILVVDDSEIKEGDYSASFAQTEFLPEKITTGQLRYLDKMLFKKIIAHLPLNGSPILEGVDLLPPLEDGVEQLAEIEFPYTQTRTDYATEECRNIWKGGYNKARERYQYTEEDIRKAIKMSADIKYVTFSEDEIIQSLSQYPTEFECIMEYNLYTETDRPRTTTINGHKVWVGKYI